MSWPSMMAIGGFTLYLEDGTSRILAAYLDQFDTRWIVRCSASGLRWTRLRK